MKKLGLGFLALTLLVSCSSSDASNSDSSLAAPGDESLAESAQALGQPQLVVDNVNPESIAVSGTQLFFIHRAGSNYQVMNASTVSPGTSVVASYVHLASSIVVDTNNVYWTVPTTLYDDSTNGGLWYRSLTGGPPHRFGEWHFSSWCIQALFATGDSESNVFHAQFRSSIYRAFHTPAAPSSLWLNRVLFPASTTVRPRTLTVDTSNVLFAEDDGDVFVLPRTGGTPRFLGTGSRATSPVGQTLLASDGTSAYFSSATAISKIPIAGGTATTFATVGEAPAAMAIDGGFLYWACRGCGTVMRKGLSSGSSTTVATGESAPHSLAFDASNIYFGTSTSLKRVAK